jgi:hypothetical protein
MAIRDKTIFIDSDNIVKLLGVNDGSAEVTTYINDATVLLSIFEGNTIALDVAPVVDDGGGLVTLAIAGNTLVAGEHIRITGTKNLNGEYDLEAGTSGTGIQITATYVAENITTNGKVYQGFTDASELVMVYVAGSNGDYITDVPETINLFEGEEYWSFIHIEDLTNNVKVIRIPLQANYATD